MRQRLARITGDFRRRRVKEIGADRAARHKHRGRESGGICKPPGRYTRHQAIALLKPVTTGHPPAIISDFATDGCACWATVHMFYVGPRRDLMPKRWVSPALINCHES